MRLFSIVCVLAAAIAVAGCAKPADEPASPAAVDAAPAPQPASTPAPAAPAEPTPAAKAEVALPEGFSAHFHVHPEMTVSSAETVDAAQGQYKVMGELRASSREVLDYFVKYFHDNGWEEDAVMEQEGNAVVSFTKDGYLQYVDTHEGGIGAQITITTGRE